MTWKRDARPENVRSIGDFKIFSETRIDGGVKETAHVVRFPDGREIRVLPDPAHNGRVRAVVVRGALEALNDRNGPLDASTALLVVIGALSRAGLKYQELAGEVSIEEWLLDWLIDHTEGHADVEAMRDRLLQALDADGWTITRGEK